MDVFVEPVAPPPSLYVFGAGHVGQHVARLAADVGFRVHVVDDRQKFADPALFPDAVEVVVDVIPDWLRQAALLPGAFAVVLTRGHRYDLDTMRELVGRDLRYLGLIGSRAKIVRLFDLLLAEGVPPEHLQRIRAPIGLDIGAVTPEEIAVAIVAELIAAKYDKLPEAGEGRSDPGLRSLKWTPASVRT
jgi:xanthine dehydrogenase accessory factor